MDDWDYKPNYGFGNFRTLSHYERGRLGRALQVALAKVKEKELWARYRAFMQPQDPQPKIPYRDIGYNDLAAMRASVNPNRMPSYGSRDTCIDIS